MGLTIQLVGEGREGGGAMLFFQESEIFSYETKNRLFVLDKTHRVNFSTNFTNISF